jgi:hypothetical protein
MFCKDLANINISLNNFINIKNTAINSKQIQIINYPNIDANLATLLKRLNIYVSRAEVFYIPPETILPIHIDLDKFSNIVKLNWVIGGGEMIWWTPNNDNYQSCTTPIGTKYLLFNEADCTETHRQQIGFPSLVNVGIPHSVNNNTKLPRWCISHNIHSISTKKQLEWNEAYSMLEPLF